MRAGDDIAVWTAVGVGLTTVWLTPLIAAWRRRGRRTARPPGWRTLIAAGLCGLAAGAGAVWIGFDLAPKSLGRWQGWEALPPGQLRQLVERDATIRQAVERAGAMLTAAAQGLSLLALVFAWRAWETAVPDAVSAISDEADAANPLDAPFPSAETQR